eukprot:scaffold12834_cov40-Phaeocystis_antarctica.AAC.2
MPLSALYVRRNKRPTHEIYDARAQHPTDELVGSTRPTSWCSRRAEPATLCHRGCHLTPCRLQPYALEAATLRLPPRLPPYAVQVLSPCDLHEPRQWCTACRLTLALALALKPDPDPDPSPDPMLNPNPNPNQAPRRASGFRAQGQLEGPLPRLLCSERTHRERGGRQLLKR